MYGNRSKIRSILQKENDAPKNIAYNVSMFLTLLFMTVDAKL